MMMTFAHWEKGENVAEYIEREAVKSEITAYFGPEVSQGVLRYLNHIPAADVAAARHGKWIETQVETGDPFGGENYYTIDVYACSECGEMFDISEARNYCPNCGARMDGDTNA